MRSKHQKKLDHGKVGSDAEAIKEIGGKGDFGVRADDEVGRKYASAETKLNDPGAAPSRIKIGDEARETGVGSNESGNGSGSGGDIDTDIVGVGFGGDGLAQSGPDERSTGPDMTDQGSPEKKTNPNHPAPRQTIIRGSTVDRSGGDITTTGNGLDAGSASNPEARQDDSFAADIQLDEAAGADNSASDNQ